MPVSFGIPLTKFNIGRIENIQEKFIQILSFTCKLPFTTYNLALALFNIPRLRYTRLWSADLCLLHKIICGPTYIPDILDKLLFRISAYNSRTRILVVLLRMQPIRIQILQNVYGYFCLPYYISINN